MGEKFEQEKYYEQRIIDIYKDYKESHKEGYMIDFKLVKYMKEKLQGLEKEALYYKHRYGLFLIQRHMYEWKKVEVKLFHNLENEIYELKNKIYK